VLSRKTTTSPNDALTFTLLTAESLKDDAAISRIWFRVFGRVSFFILFFLFRFSSLGFLPFDVLNIYAFFIFEKKKMKLFFALVGAA
jgi:hypothetical protein